jgi:hypothetical protein
MNTRARAVCCSGTYLVFKAGQRYAFFWWLLVKKANVFAEAGTGYIGLGWYG